MLCLCTITSILSSGMSNRRAASIISSPLFIIVAESMVIFAPIDQFGCLRACSAVTSLSSSAFLPKNGPPDAVRISFFICFLSGQPCMDWNIAECSLSTGSISTRRSFARLITVSPPATSVSLFARAIRLPASIALTVGNSPAIPTRLLRSVSVFRDAHSRTPL